MRILIVASYLPFPLYSGGHIRLYNLIKELSTSHKITLICERREYQTEKDVNAVLSYCEQVITVPRKKQWTMKNIFVSGLTVNPFLLVGHINKEMKHSIVSALNDKHFDVIHVETFYVYQNLPKTYLPIVLAEHNIEFLVYKRYMSVANFFFRPFLTWDVMKMKWKEQACWKSASQLIAVSEKEKSIMHLPHVTIVPNGVDTKLYKMKSIGQKIRRKEKRILFIGDFKWIQNIQSTEHILTHIWPKIQEKIIQTTLNDRVVLWIVGKRIPLHIKSHKIPGVLFDEQAPNETWKIYHQADILLAPIYVGGGTSYKILESMASGLPVVTTQLGIDGIGAKHNKEVLIGETNDELVNHCMHLLLDMTLYERICNHARHLIEEKYDWKPITKTLEGVYKQAMLQT